MGADISFMGIGVLSVGAGVPSCSMGIGVPSVGAGVPSCEDTKCSRISSA